MKSIIIGYHLNDLKRCSNFVKTKELILSKDEEFCGLGMYFWDNRHNARTFWLEEKIRKAIKQNKDKEIYALVLANIGLDQCLDLTDEDIENNILNLWAKLSPKLRGKKPEGEGEILDAMFNFYEMLDVSYNVVKINVRYKHSGEISPLFRIKNRIQLYITTKNRTIYCVRKQEGIIGEPVLEEVIEK